jgi:1,4-dihydroxy-2-naphthoyl-CoA hydrolase
VDPAELSSPFVDYLGLEITEASESRVVARWTAAERHHQPYGIVHGGVHASVVETLGSVGSAMWFGDRGKVVGVSNSTDFYRAVTDGSGESVATPVHQGRTQQVWVVETRDAEDRLIARGQLRVQNLPA